MTASYQEELISQIPAARLWFERSENDVRTRKNGASVEL
jgi:hypothetical protein